MREALAFVFLIVLICFGWSQSFQDHYEIIFGSGEPAVKAPRVTQVATSFAPATAAYQPAAAQPPHDRSWMWEKSAMDEPHDKKGSRGR